MTETYTPQVMNHPQFSPAVCNKPPGPRESFDPAKHTNVSIPARFPPITVKTKDQEEDARAKGYLLPGEAPPQVAGYFDYPKMMRHPDHIPGFEAQTTAERQQDGSIKTWTIPATPDKFPHVFVKTPEEESAAREKGYEVPTKSDPAAFSRAKSAALPEGYTGGEWPKMVNGVLMQDPNTPKGDPNEYPKWVNDPDRDRAKDQLVHSREEENRARQEVGLPLLDEPKPAPKPDPVRAALIGLANARGVEVGPDWTNEQIEAALFPPATALSAGDQKVSEEESDPVLDRKALIAELTKRGVEFDKHTPTKHLQALLSEAAA